MSFPLFKSWFSFSRLLSFSNFFLCSAFIYLLLSPFLSLYLFFLPLNLFSFSCVILALFLSLVSLFFLFFCPPIFLLSLCHPLPIFSLLQYLLHLLSSSCFAVKATRGSTTNTSLHIHIHTFKESDSQPSNGPI